jgi:hypothetical protein
MEQVKHMGEDRKLYRILVGKPEGKRPLGMPRSRWDLRISVSWADWLGDSAGLG